MYTGFALPEYASTEEIESVNATNLTEYKTINLAAIPTNELYLYNETIEYFEYQVPTIDVSFKAYMDYRKITDETSSQWELQQQAHTDEFGLRKVGELYCVAVGTYYAKQCGETLTVALDDGTEFEVVVSDIKDDIHTDKNNMYTPMKNGNGNLLEFIVDTDFLPREIIKLGDVSTLGMSGNIKSIKGILDDNN